MFGSAARTRRESRWYPANIAEPFQQGGSRASERAGTSVYRSPFRSGERQCLDRHTFEGDDRPSFLADRMPGVALPILQFHERAARDRSSSLAEIQGYLSLQTNCLTFRVRLSIHGSHDSQTHRQENDHVRYRLRLERREVRAVGRPTAHPGNRPRGLCRARRKPGPTRPGRCRGRRQVRGHRRQSGGSPRRPTIQLRLHRRRFRRLWLGRGATPGRKPGRACASARSGRRGPEA